MLPRLQSWYLYQVPGARNSYKTAVSNPRTTRNINNFQLKPEIHTDTSRLLVNYTTGSRLREVPLSLRREQKPREKDGQDFARGVVAHDGLSEGAITRSLHWRSKIVARLQPTNLYYNGNNR